MLMFPSGLKGDESMNVTGANLAQIHNSRESVREEIDGFPTPWSPETLVPTLFQQPQQRGQAAASLASPSTAACSHSDAIKRGAEPRRDSNDCSHFCASASLDRRGGEIPAAAERAAQTQPTVCLCVLLQCHNSLRALPRLSKPGLKITERIGGVFGEEARGAELG